MQSILCRKIAISMKLFIKKKIEQKTHFQISTKNCNFHETFPLKENWTKTSFCDKMIICINELFKRMLSFYNNSKLAHDEHFKFSQTWTIFEPWTIFEDLRIKRIKTSIQPTIHPLHGSQCPFPNSSPPLGAWERPNVDQIFSKYLVGKYFSDYWAKK